MILQQKSVLVKSYLKKIQDSFPQVARSVGIPTNDLSSGMVAILAGAYMAYNNVSLNDSYMKPMAKQFKEALESVSEFDKMSDSDKKYVYRHPGKGTEEYINRLSEAASMRVAAELGIDQTFVAMDENEGWNKRVESVWFPCADVGSNPTSSTLRTLNKRKTKND